VSQGQMTGGSLTNPVCRLTGLQAEKTYRYYQEQWVAAIVAGRRDVRPRVLWRLVCLVLVVAVRGVGVWWWGSGGLVLDWVWMSMSRVK